jgi:hypothetical protein
MISQDGPAICRRAVDLPLGQIVSTPGALDALAKASQSGAELIDRHRSGDWGEVDSGDWALNDRALIDGDRVLSAYRLKDDTRIWIITESDRSVTTLLLPEEY